MRSHPKLQGRRGGLTRRTFGMAAAGMLLAAQATHAQSEWPNRPIKLIVPFAAGVSPDVVARIVSDHLSKAIKQPVIVDNKPGAAGIIGAEAAARSAGDGYTLFMTVNSIMGINPHVYSKLPYDPLRDFVPVTQVVRVPYLLVTGSSTFASLPDLIAKARAKPGSIDYASLGVGSGPHAVMEMFTSMAGIRLSHVPYKSTVIPDLLAGVVPLTFEPATTAIPLIRSGKLRALGITTRQRLANLPEVPAIGEVVPGYDGDGWQGFYMPAGTPPAVVSRMNAELVAILAKPEVKARLVDLGLLPVGNTAQEFAKITKDDYENWGRIARQTGMRAD